MINKGIVIGIDGLTATGKSTVAKKLIKKHNNIIHLEMSQLFKKVGEWYVLLKNQNYSKNDINYFIKRYIKFSYQVINKEVIFSINLPKPILTMSNFYIKNEIYNLSQEDEIRKYLYKSIRKCINELKENNAVILTGRRLNQVYSELDYHFCLKASQETIAARLIERENISNDEAKLRKIEEKIYQISSDVITVDTERMSRQRVVQLIENILNSSKKRSKIIKVHFIGAPSTGKSTICRYCANKYKEPYTTEYVRDYMIETGMNNKDLAVQGFDFWSKILKRQLILEKKKEKLAKRFLFADSGPLTIGIGKGWMDNPEMLDLIDKQLKEAEIIFLCDNNFGFVNDGMRPGSFTHSDDVEKKTISFLNEKKIPYIVITGTIEERFKTIQQVLKKYEVY